MQPNPRTNKEALKYRSLLPKENASVAVAASLLFLSCAYHIMIGAVHHKEGAHLLAMNALFLQPVANIMRDSIRMSFHLDNTRSHPGQPEIVLLDHGLYRSLSDSLRLSYARLWKVRPVNRNACCARKPVCCLGKIVSVCFPCIHFSCGESLLHTT